MADASERFLDAYSRVERYLRKASGAERGVPFGQLVRDAARSNRVVRRYRDDLLEFAELRNAIVHQRIDGRPIAEPHEATAAQFSTIADLLDRPPRLLPRFAKTVACTEPTAPLREALARMRDGDYSVMPVYDRDSYRGLLTSSSIARWLAGVIADGLDAAVTVAAVLERAKHPEGRVAFLAQNASVFDALDQFQRFSEKGQHLDAIVITEHAKRDEMPLGIVTAFDVPALLDMIS